jgi:hypothetical protein
MANIKSTKNSSGNEVFFVKLEDNANNKLLKPGAVDGGDVWCPWVSNEEDFKKKAIIVMAQSRVLGFLWESDGRLKFSVSGWDPNAGDLDGVHEGDIRLIIGPDGTLKGEQD